MGRRLRDILVDPNNLKSVADALTEVISVLDREVSIGDPQDPTNDASTQLAGAAGPPVHNGDGGNLIGDWCEEHIDTAGAAVTFNHNLGLPVVNGEPNVFWIYTLRHSGLLAIATSHLNLDFDDTLCTVTTNSIDLVLRSDGVRTVNGANPVRARVRFFPVTRYP